MNISAPNGGIIITTSGTNGVTVIGGGFNAATNSFTTSGNSSITNDLWVQGTSHTGNLITTNGVFYPDGTPYSTGGPGPGTGTPSGSNKT